MADDKELEKNQGTPGDGQEPTAPVDGASEDGDKTDGDSKPGRKGKEAAKVVMDKETFEQIMANQQALLRDVKVLREAVNQGRLQQAEDKLDPKAYKRTFLKVMNLSAGAPRVVVGWKSAPQNKVIRNPNTNMPVGEVLQAEYYFLGGGSTGMIEQVEFTRTEDVIHARVLQDISPTEWIIQFENLSDQALVDEKKKPVTFEPIEWTKPDGEKVTFENALRINKAFCNP